MKGERRAKNRNKNRKHDANLWFEKKKKIKKKESKQTHI